MLLLHFNPMRYFWPIYILVAVAATAGVYYAAPLARPYIPELLKFQLRTTEPLEGEISELPPPKRGVVTDAPKLTAPEPTTPTQPQNTTPTKMLEADDDMPPILLGIQLAGRGDKRGWGITHQAANYYAANGTRLGEVVAGTLIKYLGTQSSSKGAMVECQLQGSEHSDTPVLIGASSLYIFTGDYQKLSGKQLADLNTYYTLNGKIAQRKKELLQISAAKNPHFNEYQAKHKRLMDHLEEAKALAKQRDATTTGSHILLDDKLRTMKHRESQLNREYQEIHEKFRAWKEAHTAELPQPNNDPSIKEWLAQKSALFSRIPGLAY